MGRSVSELLQILDGFSYSLIVVAGTDQHVVTLDDDDDVLKANRSDIFSRRMNEAALRIDDRAMLSGHGVFSRFGFEVHERTPASHIAPAHLGRHDVNVVGFFQYHFVDGT